MLGRLLRWLLPLTLDCGLRRRLRLTLNCLWRLLRLTLDGGLRCLLSLTLRCALLLLSHALLRLLWVTLHGGASLLRRRLDRYGPLNAYATRLRRLSA